MSNLHPKTQLQELLTPIERATLKYETVRNGGPDHVPRFDCKLYLRGHTFEAIGSHSKKEAEASVAQKAISYLFLQ